MHAIRFRDQQYERGLQQIRHGMEELGVNGQTKITVLSDGDTGLRTVQGEVAPGSEHILDWFHIGMRFEHLLDASKAIRQVPMAAHVSKWAHDLATRAKWALWNGQADKTLTRLEARRWTLAERWPTPEVRKLRRHATDLLNYLRANQDSLPNYGERHREGGTDLDGLGGIGDQRNHRQTHGQEQQMRWNRWTVQPFLAVRTAVLNNTLADSFRHWFPGFRPVAAEAEKLLAA